MFFKIANKKYLTPEQVRVDALMNAYFVIDNYTMSASEQVLNQHLLSAYNTTLKNACLDLLLSTTFYKDNSGNIIIMFKDPKKDLMARLITYGNGAIPGSMILKYALNE